MRSLYLTIFFLVVITACKESKKVDPVDPVEEIDVHSEVFEKIAKIDSLGKFSEYLKTAKVPESATGFTILAPSNSAIGNEPKGDKLPDGSVVEDYIIKGKIDFTQVRDGQILVAISGKELTVHVMSNGLYINSHSISDQSVLSGGQYNVYTLGGLLNTPKEYLDIKANEYFIEFYDNGEYFLLKNSINPWQFYSPQEWQPLVTGSNYCGTNVYTNYTFVENPGMITTHSFNWSVLRESGSSLPEPTEYTNKNKKGILAINGAGVDCNNPRSYFSFNIKEVKVMSDLGLEKKGFYSGTFDAILYYSSALGMEGTEHIITNGKFLLPIGGKEAVGLKGKGNPPVNVDKKALLAKDKWFLYSIYGSEKNETVIYPEHEECLKDDYLIYDPVGLVEHKAGAMGCGDCDDCYGTAIWTMSQDSKSIYYEGDLNKKNGYYIGKVYIIELSENVLSVRSNYTDDGKSYYYIQTYKHVR